MVDASALVYAIRWPSASDVRHRLAEDSTHAPHLIDAEVGNVLRRQALRRDLADEDARTLLDAAATLVESRYEMSRALCAAAWDLRANLSFYDALYVALAGALGVPLLTADARLARSPRLPCAVEVVAAVA